MDQKTIVFIVGPTAAGKTDVAFRAAQQINAEIISCDSMQVYREISIASSKPPKAMLAEVKHHLVDIVSIQDDFDVNAFNQRALESIEQARGNGRIPLVVGGSGLYVQVLLDGIFQGGGKDEQVRAQLKERLLVDGPEKMYAELAKVDPAAANKIHVNDARRVVRALEVFYTTSKPISELQQQRRGLWGAEDVRLFGLTRPREELYQRIDARVDQMFDQGLVEEIEKIKGKELSKTAGAIIGIKEVLGYFHHEYDLAEAKALMKRNTRRFAKRQLTWFRRDERIRWLDVSSADPDQDIAGRIVSYLEKS